ncbi:hypothetical protein M885DRAFT_549709 [Pelagophyceae sp. CCMP2097]|nr:hypothetical protein M885DRAFT_549709 [Pelagophyceae sp. CCMP2097]
MLARRKKDELVGKIAAHYLQLHRDAPIGLSASTLDQLKKHYDHIKSQSGKETAVGSATQV